VSETDLEYKTDALDILDALTCTKDDTDPQYDVEKDVMRDELLVNTDYSALKVELRTRGLKTGGDKLEMMIRLMLHIIDPSVDLSESTGREANLQYVSDADLDTKKIRMVPKEDREEVDMGPDSEDLAVLRRKFVTSPSNKIGGSPRVAARPEKPKIVMDGLTRRELEFSPLCILSDHSDEAVLSIRAYITGGRDVLRTWEKISPVIVMIADEKGWRNKENRVFADEVAFYNQAIVVVPDINLNSRPEEVFDQVVSSLHFSANEYDSKAVSLLGLGRGGGVALTVASELARCTTVSFKKPSMRSTSTSEVTPNEDDDEDDEALRLSLSIARSQVPGYVRGKREVDPVSTEPLLLSRNSSVSHETLASYIPCAVSVINPSHYSIHGVGQRLVSPLYAVFGEMDTEPGSR
jgi:hypothetical protein